MSKQSLSGQLKKIRYAVIPTAGFGTRMLPLSKAIPKELLPLGDKPAIHYVVQEATACGIDTIVLVNHAQKQAVENYFDVNGELYRQLCDKGKNKLADGLQILPDDVQIVSVRQGRPLGLGHAILQAKAVVGNNPFAVLLPDVVLDPACDCTQNLSAMIKQFISTNRTQILVDTVAYDKVQNYGIARLADTVMGNVIKKGETTAFFDALGFVEKPSQDIAPSNLAVVGRYVFSPQIFAYLANTAPSVGGEIQLTSAIDALIAKQGVDVATLVGQSFDVGDMASYAQAFCYFAKQAGLLND